MLTIGRFLTLSFLVLLAFSACNLCGTGDERIEGDVKVVDESNDDLPDAFVRPDGRPVPRWDAPPPMDIDVDGYYVAKLNTTAGVVVIELMPSNAPLAVNNFIFLAKQGFYDDVSFHRVIPGFVIQGGDPGGTGRGGPRYHFADELIGLPYRRGAVAMANAGPNMNGSQFFIMHADHDASLQSTIFGQVVSGLEVVDAIATAPTLPEGEGSTPVEPVLIESIELSGPHYRNP